MNGWILAQSTGKYLASAELDTVLAYVGLEILVESYNGMLAVALSRVLVGLTDGWFHSYFPRDYEGSCSN